MSNVALAESTLLKQRESSSNEHALRVQEDIKDQLRSANVEIKTTEGVLQKQRHLHDSLS